MGKAGGDRVSGVEFGAAPSRPSRDRYIGWSAEARRRNIRGIAYNTRFLILPWVQIPHGLSHILGRVAHTLSHDPGTDVRTSVYFAETFIDQAVSAARVIAPPTGSCSA